MFFQDFLSIDYAVHSWFSSIRSDTLTAFFNTITTGGSWQFVVVSAALIVVVLYVRERQHFIVPLIMTLVSGATITFILKIVVARPRALDALVLESDFSFPSGHATIAMAFYGFLIYIGRQLIQSRRGRQVATGLGLLVILLVGVSRLYLGVHYLSDVVVGYGIGGAALLFSIYFNRKRTIGVQYFRMKNLDYKLPIFIALALNILLFTIISSDYFWRQILGVEGVYAGIIAGAYVIIVIPVTAVLSGVLSAWKSKQMRIWSFMLALILSLLFSAIALKAMEQLNDYNLDKYYQENPLQRADNDPLNPLSIATVDPWPIDAKFGDTVKISVYAHDSLASSDGVIPIRMEIRGKKVFYRTTFDNQQVVDKEEGIFEERSIAGLKKTAQKAPDGRSVYKGTVTLPQIMTDGTPIEFVHVFFANYSIDEGGGFIVFTQKD